MLAAEIRSTHKFYSKTFFALPGSLVGKGSKLQVVALKIVDLFFSG